jgi:hypothetical protein
MVHFALATAKSHRYRAASVSNENLLKGMLYDNQL